MHLSQNLPETKLEPRLHLLHPSWTSLDLTSWIRTKHEISKDGMTCKFYIKQMVLTRMQEIIKQERDSIDM